MQSITYTLIQIAPIVSEHSLHLTVADAMTEKFILLHSRNTCLCLLFYCTFGILRNVFSYEYNTFWISLFSGRQFS